MGGTGDDEDVLCFGNFILDRKRGCLRNAAGGEIPLRPKSYDVLQLFAQNAGRMLTKNRVLDAVWPNVHITEDSLVQCVRDVRRALGDPSGTVLRTVARRGYIFDIEVRQEPRNRAVVRPVSRIEQDSSDAPGGIRAPAVQNETNAPVSSRMEGLPNAERRQLTIMQCALGGAALIAAQQDPEDLLRLLGTFHESCVALATQAGGGVAKLLPDGALVFFGYPRADEHQAERAIRAALAIVNAPCSVAGTSPALHVRVGIATGVVVVGGLLGVSGELAAVGEAATLATALLALADPDPAVSAYEMASDSGGMVEPSSPAARRRRLATRGQVVIDATTRWQIGNLFDCQKLSTTMPAWRIWSENHTLGQFEALRSTGLTPMVGRDEEMELLLRRWATARAGEGRVVLISSDPGVGKSRLAVALAERVAADSHIRLRYFCSPYQQDSPLYPVITQMERAAGFELVDRAGEKLAKLQKLIAAAAPSNEDVALIADLHALCPAHLAPLIDISSQRKKDRTFEALVRQLESLAHRQPLLMLFDDIHWIDPSSLELLDRVIERVAAWPVLLLAMFRPEFRPPWVGQPHVTLLTLTRLDRRDTTAMIANVARDSLCREIVEDIAERTDGVPLFVEELTKAIVESGAQHSVSGVPATLLASLAARLDCLGPGAKDVAQAGAVIGREFSFGLLAAIIDLPESQLCEGLDRLTEAGLLFVRGRPPQSNYLFKHALVQDAAYDSLLRTSRLQLHARVAAVLEQHFTDLTDRQPELLARHYTEAGLLEPAITFWRRAGALSLMRSAHREALGHLGRAFEILGALPQGEARDRDELDVAVTAAVPLIAIHGFGSAQVEAHALRAKALANRMPHSPVQFAAHRAVWNSSLLRQPIPTTLKLAQDLMRLAGTTGDPGRLAIAHRALGFSLLMAGRLAEAADALTRGMELADPVPDSEFALYGEHPSMVCRVNAGRVYGLMGSPEIAADLASAGVAHARSRTNPHSLAWALSVISHAYAEQGEPALTFRFASEAIEVAGEHRLPQWFAHAQIMKGWAMCRLGEISEGLALQETGERDWRATGAVLDISHYRKLRSESYLLAGDLMTAREHLAVARAHCESHGENYMAAEICRLMASILQTEGAASRVVEHHLNEALSIARDQGARLLELRSATSLAKLWGEQGRRTEAHTLLAPIYNRFAQGFDFADLQAARGLLDTLA
jgi:DNA-binding winged helix-turn-helix (wHTH) protein/tetratricopeptide (TPR) repeat protein